jgi:hypothetical protein
MSELKDRLLKQLETDYSENARECLEIYEALEKLNNGSIPSDQWMVLTNVKHLKSYSGFTRVYIPSKIGYIFLKGLKNQESKTLLITEKEAREIYSISSGSFRNKLENSFGVERLTFRNLVKTYEDACEILDIVPEIDCDNKSELAYLKLIRIYKAANMLNDKWWPKYSDNLYAYYPSFRWKENEVIYCCISCRVILLCGNPLLCCGTKEDAIYIGTQFMDLYKDYLMIG